MCVLIDSVKKYKKFCWSLKKIVDIGETVQYYTSEKGENMASIQRDKIKEVDHERVAGNFHDPERG